MDRNLWLAIALSVGVYAIWFGFFDKRVNPPKPAAAASAPAAGAAVSAASGSPAAPGAGPAQAGSAPDDAKAVLAASDPVEFDGVAARVSARGAGLASYLFQGPLAKVELVSDAASPLFATWPELEFRRDPKAKGLVWTAARADGLRLSKEFLPGSGTVLPRLVVTAFNATRRPLNVGPWTLTIGPGLGTVEAARKDNPKYTSAVGLPPDATHVETLKPGAHPGPYRWLAVDNNYFLAAVMPSADHFEPASVSAPAALALTAKAVTLAPNGTFTWEIPYYLGSKGHVELERYGVGLEKSIDYGFFRDIGRPIFFALERLHRLTNNWGWAIILLTLGLQALVGPLTYKSLKAAAMMRKLQPEIQRLQQRYKDDPQRMNTEMMALYKREGTNPLGGCLPMLLQMPIFVALYNVLRTSWELHGQAWALWIKDLSAPDALFGHLPAALPIVGGFALGPLPLLMGGLMFLQSKLNPPAGDPTQQQMMMYMPLIFTVTFLNFPSGLVLYWLTNSLVSTLLQLSLRKRLEAAA